MKFKSFKPAAWVLPQPVLIIGTYDADGTPNAMNAAWGGQWDAREVMICMGSHATTDNLNRTGEFTLSFATVETMMEADYVGVESGRKVHDKIARTGWEFSKAESVNAPVFHNFPLTLECSIKEKLLEDEGGYQLVAEILNIVCDENYLAADGRPDIEKMHLITFDPIHNGYNRIGERVGNAFRDGLALKDK